MTKPISDFIVNSLVACCVDKCGCMYHVSVLERFMYCISVKKPLCRI